MKYYLINLKKLPIVNMAHRHINDNYNLQFLGTPGRTEITFIEQGNVKSSSNNINRTYVTGTIVTFPHDKPMRLSCTEGRHCHMTVGFTHEEPLQEITEGEVLMLHDLKEHAILPEYVEASVASKMEFILKKIIAVYNSFDINSHLNVLSYLFELFAYLTDYSVSKAMDGSENSYSKMNLYCRKAASYIASHINEKINVQDIADSAGISYGYLSNLFTEHMGMTLVEYVNREKLKLVKEYITTRKISFELAGNEVGISDAKYLSRLFKKYNGITAMEYKKLKDVSKNIN